MIAPEPRDISSVRLQVVTKGFERARECLDEEIQADVSPGMRFWNSQTSMLVIQIQSRLGNVVARGRMS